MAIILNKDACWHCTAQRNGLETEDEKYPGCRIGCYPAYNDDEKQEFVECFDNEWAKGKVWCPAMSEAETTFDNTSFADIDQPVPFVCWFKEKHKS